jgi:S1-C subfamily serine protease
LFSSFDGCPKAPSQRILNHQRFEFVLRGRREVIEMNTGTESLLMSLSNELANTVELVGPSVVRVDDGSRLTASGLIWSADGTIVSTSHGVERDENVSIELTDGSVLRADIIGRDTDTDIAVLRVNASGLPAIQKSSPEDSRVGHLALALGRPGDSGLQATIGIISSRQETQTHGQPGFILHTDAVLYPGFSGGALANAKGQVMGLTNRLFGRGTGIAIGLPIVTLIVNALLAHGRVRRGYLGVRSQLVALPTALQESLGLNQERGLLVIAVEPGSPADTGGLMLGDTLLAINGQLLQDIDDLRRHLIAEQTVAVRILRGGVVQEVRITLGVTE